MSFVSQKHVQNILSFAAVVMTFSAESIRLLWIDPVFTAVYGVALNECSNLFLDLLLLLLDMGWSARTLQPRNLLLRWWENRDLPGYKKHGPHSGWVHDQEEKNSKLLYEMHFKKGMLHSLDRFALRGGDGAGSSSLSLPLPLPLPEPDSESLGNTMMRWAVMKA